MDDLFSLFETPKNPLSFNALRISLASPVKGSLISRVSA